MFMTLVLCTGVLMLILVAGMAVGVVFGRGPIKGSCGGMKALSMNTACDICGDDPAKCDNDEVAQQRFSDDAFYNAADDKRSKS